MAVDNGKVHVFLVSGKDPAGGSDREGGCGGLNEVAAREGHEGSPLQGERG